MPKSYLSRVIHGGADLNADQMSLVCEFLHLSESETDYLQLLLDYERSGLQNRKAKLLQKIRVLQELNQETKHHLEASSVNINSPDVAEYYLDPWLQIIHVCLSIKRYSQNPANLIGDLNLGKERVSLAIQKLEQMGLIARDVSGISLLKENIHLPRESPVYKSWRNQLKLMSMHQLDHTTEKNPYSFMVVFSADEATRTEIQGRFLKFINGVEKLVGKCQQENTYQISFDLFSWTKIN